MVGTEHLRWMGDFRFVVGYLKGSKCETSLQLILAPRACSLTATACKVIQVKAAPIDLYLRSATSDKNEMLKVFDVEKASHPTDASLTNGDATTITALPEDRYASETTEGGEWIKFDKQILYL